LKAWSNLTFWPFCAVWILSTSTLCTYLDSGRTKEIDRAEIILRMQQSLRWSRNSCQLLNP